MSFKMRGTTIAMNCLKSDALSYQPNLAALLKDLNINTVRFNGGREGNTWDIHMVNDPNWDTNLYNFIQEVKRLGVRWSLHEFDGGYQNLLGIVQPQGHGTMTPLDVALDRVEMLAGNNSLGYDFLSEPSVYAWCPANEVDISVASDLNWCIAMLDKIRSYGVKAYLAAPRYGSWGPGEDLSNTFSLIDGHVDYISYHRYGVWELVNNYGGMVTTEFVEWIYGQLAKQVDYCRQVGWPLDRFIYEEFGMWLGYGSDLNTSHTFTDDVRAQYYRAIYEVCKSLGITNIMNHVLPEQTMPSTYPNPADNNYGIVALDGSYYLPAYELKSAYASTPTSPLGLVPWLAGFYYMLKGRG